MSSEFYLTLPHVSDPPNHPLRLFSLPDPDRYPPPSTAQPHPPSVASANRTALSFPYHQPPNPGSSTSSLRARSPSDTRNQPTNQFLLLSPTQAAVTARAGAVVYTKLTSKSDSARSRSPHHRSFPYRLTIDICRYTVSRRGTAPSGRKAAGSDQRGGS